MSRALATLLALLAVSAACPAWGATKAAKAKAKPIPKSSVAEVVTHAGADGETMALRDLVAFDRQATAEGWAWFAEQRAAIRACHGDRYATARDNVLSGRSAPLRDC